MKHLSIYPWAMDSEPAERLRNALSKRLGYKVFKVHGHKPKSTFVPEHGQAILDWGRSDRPCWYIPGLSWLNHPDFIKNSVDKLRSFDRFSEAGVHHVPFTTSYEKALKWVQEGWVCAREDTKGYDGRGLHLAKSSGQLINYAPLYTKFIKGVSEFRAYVFRGKCIDLLKKFSEKAGDPNIRTDSNGWNYTYNFHNAPEGYEKHAIKAIKSCGLDFGGVDLLWDGNEWWVLEVNTAPDINYNAVELFADGVVDWLQGL